jgi:BTB/POZ domain-containing protein KCTD2/5/17
MENQQPVNLDNHYNDVNNGLKNADNSTAVTNNHSKQNGTKTNNNTNSNHRHPLVHSDSNGSSSLNHCKTEWIRLNIGGKYFITTKTTLCKDENSFFYKLCQDDPSVGLTTDKVIEPFIIQFNSTKLNLQIKTKIKKDETGAFLIDRDPKYFTPILNYLRHGKLIIEKNQQEEGVLEEAEFYNIQELIGLLKEKIKERDESTINHRQQHQQNIKKVYRVIQFRENEITQMMSTMSDGWNYVQVIINYYNKKKRKKIEILYSSHFF